MTCELTYILMNLKSKLLVSTGAIFAMGISSCGPVLYTTVGQNVPLFQKEGEVALSIGAATTSNISDVYYGSSANGISVQGGVAISNHIGIISSYNALKVDNYDEWTGRGNYFEFGLGAFKHNEGQRFIYEVYIGSGFGSLKSSFENEFVHAKYVKPFIQPSVGFSMDYFEVAFTPRIGLVNYSSKSFNLTDPESSFAIEDYFRKKNSTLVLEPGITIRGGLKNIKFQSQVNITTFNYTSSDQLEPVHNLYLSFGVFFLITDRWKIAK